jgi:hypothetical protein
MLWQRLAKGVEIPFEPTGRTNWGLLMQPLLIAQAQEDRHLDCTPIDSYLSRNLLGATKDAIIHCPSRGDGALETKVVFDYRVWMREWKGGDRPPRNYEIQLQVQMYVGDGVTPYNWGVLAPWVGGEMKYFEREPEPALWSTLESEAELLYDDIRAGREPDPFGVEVELPLLYELYPTVPESLLDLREDDSGAYWAERAAEYAIERARALGAKKETDRERAALIALAKGAEKVLLPDGIIVTIGKRNRLGVYAPGIEIAAEDV